MKRWHILTGQGLQPTLALKPLFPPEASLTRTKLFQDLNALGDIELVKRLLHQRIDVILKRVGQVDAMQSVSGCIVNLTSSSRILEAPCYHVGP